MSNRFLFLWLFLAAALAGRAQVFVNVPTSTVSYAFFTSFDGPIDHDTSTNYFDGGSAGIANTAALFNSGGSFSFSNPSRENGTYLLLLSITLNLNGQVNFTLNNSWGSTPDWSTEAFEVLLGVGDLELESGLRLTDFATTSNELDYVSASFDADTGFLTIASGGAGGLSNAPASYALGGTFQTAAIPEPATVALGFGLVAGLLAAWRRRAANRPPSPGPC